MGGPIRNKEDDLLDFDVLVEKMQKMRVLIRDFLLSRESVDTESINLISGTRSIDVLTKTPHLIYEKY
jgi:hypothetical protein